MSFSRLASPLLLVFTLLIQAGTAKDVTEYVVSIPNLRTAPGESVVSLEIDIVAGAIQSVSNVPVGWYFILDNDASWRTKIKGNTTIGSASLKPENLKKLQFVVKKNEFGDLKFALSGAVSVTSGYQKERQTPLTMKDFDVFAKR